MNIWTGQRRVLVCGCKERRKGKLSLDLLDSGVHLCLYLTAFWFPLQQQKNDFSLFGFPSLVVTRQTEKSFSSNYFIDI